MSEEVKEVEKIEEDPGIKEITELFEALKVLAAFGGKVMRDGKLGTSDLQYVVDVAIQFQALIEGFSGLEDLVKEAKSLKKDELIAIVGQVYGVVKAFEDAKKGQ